MFCLKCIKKSLQQSGSTCPHCRNMLSVETIVNCRWMNDVVYKLSDLERSLCDDETQGDTCPEHSEKLKV